jgi:hypothetical protein
VAADDGVDRVALAVEAEDRARSHDFADREPARDIGDGIRRDGETQPAAQRCKPLELLAVLELGEDRRIADDADQARIADLAGAHGVELGALAGVIEVALDPGEQDASEPVVAGLCAADRAVEVTRGAGCEQPGAASRDR